ncbi:MAG: efflux RND transporter periplasmic adaptor subunit [Microcoleus sp. PH2017_10_PVI_O_A]|uniref:efflux RND transporter periplasmic adaptor subunit n=1 Tax=unclassified Microcoleus TaxID=2642155 RepID=UPI001D3BFEA7|nr:MULTISPECIES: efflux RND transporter periplasmic adaptor subunit [unclassified Microcoleus]TAE83490.1 MAG: efflux RND transporter periplasmic adaptor subunit [Oscillatoriales cyanobacterium]MCC3404482.1 efflux RND transporter periplasmic adaptor subunit [Microcoleus sp. PH2017_10_PVI_O_A]MCC3458550.1 efflux RND transporter periplasmic adaptor subunit [Microcoleus sp. PH2017_11_PCY_U_A]MCC3476800.1 efflux RND transporter periplasmic adaptor subunit [Microcoleus sp. PH2017_12_PCY_D_A]MCC35269
MIFHKYSQFPAIISSFSVTFISLILLSSPVAVFAHAGHGNEFHQSGETTQTPAAISVGAETAKRLGIKVSPATRQQLDIGIKTTGQIETLPNQKVEVTAPVAGKVVELLVKPGDRVSKGQSVAVLSSSELGQWRVESLSKRAEAEADLQQAQGDLKLATENYDRQLQISAAEIIQARTQLAATTQQYQREKELVNKRSVVKVAKENYQRQVAIAQAEIARAETELTVAKEQFDRDRELVASGAIARRTMLESQARFAEAKASVAKAKSRPEVIRAETEIKQAEVDLPMRELRDSQGKVAEAKAQLTKAQSRREVLEAQNQVKRGKTAVQVARSRIRLADAAYQARLQQLGTVANDRGLVTVIAPISGTVADRAITPGESVSAEKPLMSLLNDSRVFATANIYEKDLNQVKQGQEVRVKVAHLGDRIFKGKITLIGSSVEGETRVVPVKAELDNSNGELKPGLFAELEILTDKTATNVLAIPSAAVVDVSGKKTVYVQNGDAYQAVDIEVGQTAGDLVEVKSGLFDGDLIVTQRAPQLYAQSLRGGSKQSTSEEKKEATPKVTEVNLNNLPVSLWAGIGGGIAIASVTFFAAGVFWGKRRKLPAITADSANNGFSTSEPVLNDKLLLHNDNHHVKTQEAEVKSLK